MEKGRILVVDGDTHARTRLAELLRAGGFAVETAADGDEALRQINEGAPDLMVTELLTPAIGGLELVRQARAHSEDLVVLVMTAAGDLPRAVEAMQLGAANHLTRPVDRDELALLLERELATRRLRLDVRGSRARLAERFGFDEVIGSAPPMQRLLKAAVQAAALPSSVLITGESGTGKRLLATALHHRSPRASRPFVRIRGASLSESRLESELSGRQGGTVFLDEVGAISLALQRRLLHILQEKDVRIVATTTVDLEAEAAAGRILEELRERLSAIVLQLPPLRDRASDIPLLLAHFVGQHRWGSGALRRRFDERALEQLGGYSWPGNVAELRSVVDGALLHVAGSRITGADLPAHVRSAPALKGLPIPGATLEEIERHAIVKTLEATEGSSVKAAEMLGISVRKVQYKRQEYGAGRLSRPIPA